MLEQDLNPAATKFISSLVRSLQILCNGQVEFNETIELVGHINVKIDHKFKFDYIVDEHVSKEGEDSSTTFLSNSYHSCRPAKQSNKKQNPSELEQDVIFSEIPKNTQKREKLEKNLHKIVEKTDCGILGRESNTQNYSVSIEPLDRQFNEPNQIVVKLEGGDDSNDCMVLPASPGEYEGEENRTESYPVPGPSSSFDDSLGNQTVHTRKKRKFNNQGADDPDSKVTCGNHSSQKSSTLHWTVPPHHSDYPTTFADHGQLVGHLPVTESVRKDLGFPCRACPDVFSNIEEYNYHMECTHRYVPCNQCTVWCPSAGALRGHIHREHKPKFVCSICLKTFHCNINFTGHMNMHKGVKPYTCTKCNRSFSYQQSLHAHQKTCSYS